MELKQGYKQTDVGVIPDEWDVSTISDCIESNGLIRGPFGGALKKEFFVPSGYKVYEQKNAIYKSIELGQYYIDKEKFVELSRFQIKANDFIVSCSGTIGRIYLIPQQYKEGVINQALLIIRINSSKCSKAYFEHCFSSDWFQTKITDSTQGGAMKNMVGMAEFKISTIPLPPLSEQTAIAKALSDMDALISQTEKLIEKKKAIKQGTMQELLKPKDGWVKTCLIELAEGKKQQFDDGDWVESEFIVENGEVRLIQTGNIGIGKFLDKNSKKFIKNTSFYYLNCKEVIEGDLLICRLAEPAGRACIMPNIGEEKVITSVDVTIFRGSKNIVNREYLQQLFSSKIWFKKVLEKVGGTTHKRISRSSLGKIEILVPKIQEQNRIADILSTMDKDIDLQFKKLTKLKQQKQGMMQALLTGKIRLVS